MLRTASKATQRMLKKVSASIWFGRWFVSRIAFSFSKGSHNNASHFSKIQLFRLKTQAFWLLKAQGKRRSLIEPNLTAVLFCPNYQVHLLS